MVRIKWAVIITIFALYTFLESACWNNRGHSDVKG